MAGSLFQKTNCTTFKFVIMDIDRILSRFKRNGYNVTRCASGKIMVKQPNGFSELFDSYNEAYRHYFE